MNVLIVGLGYAGTRFLRSFLYINSQTKHKSTFIKLAYMDKLRKNNDFLYYANLNVALSEFKPEIIVVCVNDEYHFEILEKLKDYQGFIICEKPLLSVSDDMHKLNQLVTNQEKFCLDLIERYSLATITLKKYIERNELSLIRANFYWGKDRINDPRPTCGVTSEVIHALDLLQHLDNTGKQLKLHEVIGSCSDFSISGDAVLDSVSLTAKLGDAVVTGYSSFVNITRKREVDLAFVSPQNKLVYASLVFDTPEWDMDYLKIWERNITGDRMIIDFQTPINIMDANTKMIQKLIVLVSDVVDYVRAGKQPSQPFANLQTSFSLQRLLNSVHHQAKILGPVKYVSGGHREIFNDGSDLEKLG